jgi:hypothetical protein
MQQVLVTLLEPQIQYHSRTGRLVLPTTLELRGYIGTFKQLSVRSDRIAVRYNAIEFVFLSLRGGQTRNPLEIMLDLGDVRTRLEYHPKLRG